MRIERRHGKGMTLDLHLLRISAVQQDSLNPHTARCPSRLPVPQQNPIRLENRMTMIQPPITNFLLLTHLRLLYQQAWELFLKAQAFRASFYRKARVPKPTVHQQHQCQHQHQRQIMAMSHAGRAQNISAIAAPGTATKSYTDRNPSRLPVPLVARPLEGTMLA